MGLNQMGQVFRSDSMMGMGFAGYPYLYTASTEIEKRQLFLRSYQFSRKQTTSQRIKKSLFRVKKLIWVRLRSAKKIHKMIWFRLRHGFFFGFRRKRFIHLNHSNGHNSTVKTSLNCFW